MIDHFSQPRLIKPLGSALALIALAALVACQPGSGSSSSSEEGSAALVKNEVSPSPAESSSQAVANKTAPFPDQYYFYGARRPEALRKLEGQPAKPLTVKNWIGEPQSLGDLKGKIVVIDFWGTWCKPCVMALPHNVKLVNNYRDRGIVVIGVHDASRGHERMASVAQQAGINYPLSIDDGGKSARAYSVSFWPTYIVLDRQGIIRAAGLEPSSVERVVEHLLQEP